MTADQPVATEPRSTAGAGARRRGWRPALAVLVTAVALLCMPAVLAPYPLIELSYALVLGIACLGLNLVYGTTGLLSLGHAAYFGLGAYAGAFAVNAADLESLEGYLFLGLFVATAGAAMSGALCVRATRIHFTIMTLAFGQLVHAAFVTGAVYRPLGDYGKGLFFIGGGGLYIPRLTILGTLPRPERFIPVLYYVVLAACFMSLAVLWRISRSPFGMALRAIRDNDVRAAFVGVPVRVYRWRAFVISGAVVGLAGGLYGQLSRQITPEELDWLFSAKLVVATIIGGTRWFLGPVVGGIVFVLLQHVANRFALSHGFVLGTLLILVVLVCPGGIVDASVRAFRRLASTLSPATDTGAP
jgi:branched-chain amino acid transport system permease protein